MKETLSIPQKLLITVEEAAEYSHIGVHKIRELLEEKDCDFVLKKGSYSLIKRVKFEKYILDKDVI
ncbi:MAG: helix-turn-helix domain-containing protein [Lachnospiraceae bacterium]